MKNEKHSLFSVIVKENPIEVQYFEPSVKGKYHILNEEIFLVYIEDLVSKKFLLQKLFTKEDVYFTALKSSVI